MTQNEVNIEIPSSPKPAPSTPRIPKTANTLPDVFVGARRLLKNTPWMSLMAYGFTSAAILVIPALTVWWYELRGNMSSWHATLSARPSYMEAFRWSIMAAGFSFIYFMSLALFTLSPIGTKHGSYQALKRVGQVIGTVRYNLAFFVASLISLVIYLNTSLHEGSSKAVESDDKTSTNVLLIQSLSVYSDSVIKFIMKQREYFKYIPYVLLMLSTALLIEKLIILYISHSFHKSFYTKRIRRNNMVLSCFETLSLSHRPPNYKPLRSGAVIKNETVVLYAEAIFNGLLKPDRESLIIDDFLEEIDHPHAVSLFKFLDFNQSGDISLTEFKEAIQEAYEEKRILLKSIKANEKVINHIDNFFVTLVILFKLTCFIPKIKIEFLEFLAYVGGSAFALKSIFEHFIQKFFGSVMHFLVAHPYDVGDKIQMNHKNYRIKDMGFWKTTLISSDGKVSYVPNHTLFKVKFGNFGRSDRMETDILMSMKLETSKEDIKMFTEAMNEFIKENGKYFDDEIVIKEVIVPNSDVINIVFGIMHKFNFNNDDNYHFRCELIFKNMARIAKEQNLKYFTLRFQGEE